MSKININGIIREITAEELAELQSACNQMPDAGEGNELEELRQQVAMLTECLLEMSETVYA